MEQQGNIVLSFEPNIWKFSKPKNLCLCSQRKRKIRNYNVKYVEMNNENGIYL